MFGDLTWLATSIYLLSWVMAFAVGANDAANSLATSYGSGAMSLRPLVLCGGVFEFIGSVWRSQKVAGNLAYDMIDNLDE